MGKALLREEGSSGATQPMPTAGEPSAGRTGGLLVEDVVKRWRELVVLDGVELALAPGTAARISGHNGAGKTTLLRIVAGLITPDQGKIQLGGVRMGERRSRYQRQIGFLAAGDTGLYARLTVSQNLEFWAGLAFVHPSRRRETIVRALRRFGGEALASQRADRLSLGQRQRVRLAMTFLHDPRLVLLDEPTSSLDPDGVAMLVSALTEHTQRGGMVLWCSPFGREELGFDSAYELRDGRLHPA